MPLSRPRAALAVGVAATLVASPLVAVAAPTGTAAEVTLVVPLTHHPDDSGLLSSETLESATGPAGSLTRELGAIVASPSAAIALDPMIPASIRLLGEAAPPSATGWLARLEAAENEVFLLGYADADPGAFAAGEALDLAHPIDFGFAADPADFAAEATPAPDATETPAPGPPTTDALLDWAGALPPIAWPAEGSLDPGIADQLAQSGYAAVIAASSNLSETDSATAQAGEARLVVTDSAASELFREATTAVSEQVFRDAVERLGATLDGLAAAAPGRSVVLALDRPGVLGGYRLAEVAASIGSRPTVELARLSDVLAASPVGAVVVAPDPDPERTARLAALAATTRAVLAFSDVLEDPTAITAPRRLQLLSLLGVRSMASPGWPAAAAEHIAESRAITDSVQVVEGTPPLLTSEISFLPVTIANELDLPVTVVLSARPDRPIIRIDAPVTVTVEPGSSHTVRLPAQAVTNGSVVVRVELHSPTTGVMVGDARALSVELQAQWETFGLIGGVLLMVVFAIGVVRNIIRRRRAGRRDDATTDGPAPGPPATPTDDREV